jgi:hypothetical protein
MVVGLPVLLWLRLTADTFHTHTHTHHPPDSSRRGKLVIVNLQRTAMHTSAALVIHAKCDDVMAKVMAALELEVGTGCPSQWAQLTHALHLVAARL